MKILLADDSPAMRAVFRKALEKLGHSPKDIVEAQEAREVLRAFQNLFNPVDLVIFDWDLPGMDGLGLLAHLKSLGLTETVTVLLSVNRQQRALLPQVAKLGPCEAIDRPFTEEQCEEKLQSMGKVVAVRKGESSKKLRVVPNLPEPDSSMPFLVRLPAAVIDDLLKLADERQHEAGALILKTGQVCDSLHIVTRGQVEILAEGKPTRIVAEGDPVGEFSFMMSEPSTYTAKARTVVLTASLSKARIADLLRRHPGLDRHFSSLMGRHKEVMSARATTIVQSDFKGTFDTMPFANVLQILNVGRKSGVLGIRLGEHSGGIYLDNGEAVHAWTDDATGELAFYALSGWAQARFAFSSIRREDQRTLGKPTMTLLLEAMRRQEETPPGA
jgi:two-component system chemotaxis response regulator CheY